MARTYYRNGESMVMVKGSSSQIMATTQLGLAEGPIRITPRYVHQDINVDDYGPNIPIDTIWVLADCTIQMVLVHFDATILKVCMASSMGGGLAGSEGTMVSAGTLMGNNQAAGVNGGKPSLSNNYISLNILSPVGVTPWRFPSAYLSEHPVMWPLGTEKSLVELTWRAIPYSSTAGQSLSPVPNPAGEMVSVGAILWDHTIDT